MESYEEQRFKFQLEKGLARARLVLNGDKLQDPSSVPHQYQDKFGLAELLGSSTAAALLNSLKALGLAEDALETIRKWAKNRQIVLRLDSSQSCVFLREETRKEDSKTKHVLEIGGLQAITSKVVTKITSYFWKFSHSYELLITTGTSEQEKIVILSRNVECEVQTLSQKAPIPEKSINHSIDVNCTWLFSKLDDNSRIDFRIARDALCKTPRRNAEVENLLNFLRSLFAWSSRISSYFLSDIFPVEQGSSLDFKSINDETIFCPVLAVFASSKSESKELEEKHSVFVTLSAVHSVGSSEVLPPTVYINQLLMEQAQSITRKLEELKTIFGRDKVVSFREVGIVLPCLHIKTICQHFADGIDFIEDMMMKQMISALGKEVSVAEFTRYMQFHNRKLFFTQFEPKPFCYSIRKPQHSPEGIVTIESHFSDGSVSEPIFTQVRRLESVSPMEFEISASTKVKFLGERYLHSWMSCQFSGRSAAQLYLKARSRQFSSFIMVVGRVASIDLFIPKCAMIIQNKDEISIPLMLEQIPTPKEFRDAIESLSPEQQRFAKAYRQMQLESTLFGICIIQIKPQLEKLLNLPADSLTKEIKLTQDLMELFIKYQIPSDLLSYSGSINSTVQEKLQVVRLQVQAMKDLINSSKQEEIQDAKDRYSYAHPAPMRSTSEVSDSDLLETPLLPSVPMSRGAVDNLRTRSRPFTSTVAFAAVPLGGSLVDTPSLDVTNVRALRPPAPVSSPAPAPASSQLPSANPAASKPLFEKSEDFESIESVDFSKLPERLDKKLELLDSENSLRPTIINIGECWTRSSQKSLLSSPSTQTLIANDQDQERDKAFDLLDALSRSGSLPFEDASLHVVIASTHSFSKTVMQTLIHDNINPIERVECSQLIVASTIQDCPVDSLIKSNQVARVKAASPQLFLALEEKKQ